MLISQQIYLLLKVMKKSLRLALAQVVSYTYNKTKQPILKKVWVVFL